MSVPTAISTLPQRADEWRQMLVRWCDQNSGSNNTAGLAAMLELLAAAFGRLPGATVERVPLAGTAHRALRVRQRPRAPHQLFFSGHYDTVYDATDPFQRCEALTPERLRGPGVADMKGGLVTMLAALTAFEQTPRAAEVGYEVLLGPDEEIGSPGTAPLFAEAAPRFRLGLIFEPARANGDLVHSRKGTGNFTVTSHGRAAHAASGGNLGRNAIVALAEYLVAVNRLPQELPGVLLNVGSVRGGGPATNVVPDLAEAKLDVRVTQLADRAAVLARLEALAAPINARDGHRLELAGGFTRPPMERTPAADAAFAAWQAAARDLKVAPFSWVHAGGASDANNLAAAGLPCLDGLGVIGDRLHSAEEWCHLPSLVERAQIAALWLHRLAAGELKLPPR